LNYNPSELEFQSLIVKLKTEMLVKQNYQNTGFQSLIVKLKTKSDKTKGEGGKGFNHS
jgi:hypothetical protein